MLSIQILCVGTLKEKFWREGCEEYQKRLSAFCRCRITELSEARIQRDGEISAALKKEGAAMLPYLEGAYNIALCIEGRKMSSPQLAKSLEILAVSGVSKINFIIGGSWGISEDIKQRCQMKLSVSDMTFPHQLFRLMLLEQIYRAFSINANTKYHK